MRRMQFTSRLMKAQVCDNPDTSIWLFLSWICQSISLCWAKYFRMNSRKNTSFLFVLFRSSSGVCEWSSWQQVYRHVHDDYVPGWWTRDDIQHGTATVPCTRSPHDPQAPHTAVTVGPFIASSRRDSTSSARRDPESPRAGDFRWAAV